MTNTLKAIAWVLSLMIINSGIDYITGNQFDMGRVWGDHISMPVWWGLACIVTGATSVGALIADNAKLLFNAALVAFAIYLMFAYQIFDMRMLPFPWPPEDNRLLSDHLGKASIWLIIATSLWWREGVNRRKKEILDGDPE